MLFDESILTNACEQYNQSPACNEHGKITDGDKSVLRLYFQKADETLPGDPTPSRDYFTGRQTAIWTEYVAIAAQRALDTLSVQTEGAAAATQPAETVGATGQATTQRRKHYEPQSSFEAAYLGVKDRIDQLHANGILTEDQVAEAVKPVIRIKGEQESPILYLNMAVAMCNALKGIDGVYEDLQSVIQESMRSYQANNAQQLR